MPLGNGASGPTVTPRIVVSSEIADVATEAANNWQEGTRWSPVPFAPTLTVSDDGGTDADWTVTLVDHVDACATAEDPNPRGCTHYRRWRGPLGIGAAREVRHIEIRRGLPMSEFAGVVMHEYGHALGLEHAPQGLMNPDRSRSEYENPLIDAATLDAFQAAFQEISQ